MRSPRQSAIRLLQLMMIASVVLPAVLFVFASWLSYRHEQAVADDRIERTLDIVHEHSLKVFQTGERAIAEVEEVIREMADDAIAADQQRLHDRLRRIVDAVPQFQAIAVADRNGKVLASSTLTPIANDVSMADRAYFRSLAAGAEGTLVSETLMPRWGGLRNPFFTLSRRRASPDASFNGVI
jgi:two-component system, NtrC family, sensor kinase